MDDSYVYSAIRRLFERFGWFTSFCNSFIDRMRGGIIERSIPK